MVTIQPLTMPSRGGPVRWPATVLVVLALATFLVAGLAEAAAAQDQPTTTEGTTPDQTTPDQTTPDQTTPDQTTPETTTPPGPILNVEGSGALWIVGLAGLLIVILWALPVLFDVLRAYQAQKRAWDLLSTELERALANGNPTSSADLLKLVRAMRQPPVGMRGLYRALMAFTIITVVAIALTALLLSSSDDAGDLRKTVITSILSILATIVGFYFGARTAESEVPEKPEGQQPQDGESQVRAMEEAQKAAAEAERRADEREKAAEARERAAERAEAAAEAGGRTRRGRR
jgi:signal transduction histidine kinase